MLFAESFPAWLNVVNQTDRPILEIIFPRGFTIKFILTAWAILGSLLMYFLLSDFRNKLLEPVLEEPFDTAEQILERGLIPIAWLSLFYLRNSSNPAHHQLANISVIPNLRYGKEYVRQMLKNDLFGKGVYYLHALFYSPKLEGGIKIL